MMQRIGEARPIRRLKVLHTERPFMSENGRYDGKPYSSTVAKAPEMKRSAVLPDS